MIGQKMSKRKTVEWEHRMQGRQEGNGTTGRQDRRMQKNSPNVRQENRKTCENEKKMKDMWLREEERNGVRNMSTRRPAVQLNNTRQEERRESEKMGGHSGRYKR